MSGLPKRRCPDAVILVPGILGTELLDPDTSEPVWGLGAKQLVAAVVTGTIYERLRDPRLQPSRLLARTGSLPLLGRFEPYTTLADSLRRTVADRDALLEFPYDWRHPVAETSKRFAAVASGHLERWRRNPAGSRDAQLSLVAHSMGGLVCLQAMTLDADALDVRSVRQLLTLGTPYLGAVKAVRALATGEVLPLGWAIRRTTKERLRTLARETPGVYDLLPSYPATYQEGGAITATSLRRPSVDDFVAVGADRTYVEDAVDAARKRSEPPAQLELWAMVGTSQPTLQSFITADGQTTFFDHVGGIPWAGDGTVHFHASRPKGSFAGTGLAQAHGALATTSEARIAIETRLLTGGDSEWQGGGIGLQVADSVGCNEEFTITISARPGVIPTCRWREIGTNRDGDLSLGPPRRHTIMDNGNEVHIEIRAVEHAWSNMGMYTVTASGGGASDVSVDVVVEDDG